MDSTLEKTPRLMADRTHLQLHMVSDPRWGFGIFHIHAGGFDLHLVPDGHRMVYPVNDSLVSHFVIFMVQVMKIRLCYMNVRLWFKITYSETQFHQPDSSVCIATGYMQRGRRSIPVRGKKFLSTPRHPDWLWSPSRLIYPKGTEDSFPGLKGPGREADHSPTNSADVKSGGTIPPLPHTYSK
jgi:hypothetical protein